jgi:signal peptidase I
MKSSHLTAAKAADTIRPGTLIRLFLLLGAVAMLKAWVAFPTRICGPSMMPTLEDGEVHVVIRTMHRSRNPQRGDIVCIWTGEERVIKRVVGLPGESIAVRDGTVWINDRPLDEPYVTSRGDWNIQTGHLMPDHYALLGDNRELPLREHPFFVVSRGRIIGRIL